MYVINNMNIIGKNKRRIEVKKRKEKEQDTKKTFIDPKNKEDMGEILKIKELKEVLQLRNNSFSDDESDGMQSPKEMGDIIDDFIIIEFNS